MTDTTRAPGLDHLPAPELPPTMAVLTGAALGALAGYLVLSPHGRRTCRQFTAAAAGIAIQ